MVSTEVSIVALETPGPETVSTEIIHGPMNPAPNKMMATRPMDRCLDPTKRLLSPHSLTVEINVARILSIEFYFQGLTKIGSCRKPKNCLFYERALKNSPILIALPSVEGMSGGSIQLSSIVLKAE